MIHVIWIIAEEDSWVMGIVDRKNPVQAWAQILL